MKTKTVSVMYIQNLHKICNVNFVCVCVFYSRIHKKKTERNITFCITFAKKQNRTSDGTDDEQFAIWQMFTKKINVLNISLHVCLGSLVFLLLQLNATNSNNKSVSLSFFSQTDQLQPLYKDR